MRGCTVPAGNRRISQYDAYAHAYAAYVTQREQGDAGDDLGILPHLLALLGDVSGRRVLDAGCGEGYLLLEGVSIASIAAWRSTRTVLRCASS